MRKFLATAGTLALVLGMSSWVTLSSAEPALAAGTANITDTCETLSVNLSGFPESVPAKDAVFTTEYQRYSWIGNPDEIDPSTSSPAAHPGSWQANNKPNPGDDPIGQPFQQGNGDNASWFYWVATVVETAPATPAKVNTVVVTINGVPIDSQEFSMTFGNVYPFSDSTIANSWVVTATAWDNPGSPQVWSGTSTPCTTPPVDTCPSDFTSPAMWEISWGTSFENRNDPATFTTASNGGLTSLNGGPVPSYMTSYDANNPDNWRWLYVAKPATNGGYTYGFADGTVRTVTITADSNGCPTIVWSETPPPTIEQCTAIGNGGVSTNLNPNGWTFNETRATGHNQYVSGGLHVWTEGNTSTDKAAGYKSLVIPFSQVGSPEIEFASYTGVRPSVQIGFDKEGDGTWDGYLVYEPWAYGAGKWWSSKDFGVGSGMGYASFGTLNDYLLANPNAKTTNFGYSLGSGVQGDAVITSITVGCNKYTFDYEEPPPVFASFTAPTVVDQCGTENDGVIFGTSATGTWKVASVVDMGDGTTRHRVVYTPASGEVVPSPGAGDDYIIVDGKAVWKLYTSNKACPVVVETTPVIFTSHTCDAIGTVEVPAIDGVRYEAVLNGNVIGFVDNFPAGKFYATDDGTESGAPFYGDITITAVAVDDGYELDGETEWTHKFTKPDCPTAPTPPSLASTGSDSGPTLLGALGLMIVGAFFALANRFRNQHAE